MITFALHLFIDAWPSGWMKTIVDCERNPKPAFFTYRDALTPLMVNIRGDRKTYFSGEKASIELFVCNDTHTVCDDHKIICELFDENGKLALEAEFPANFSENSSFMQGDICFDIPCISKREAYTLRAILKDKNGSIIHYCDEELEFFPKEEASIASAVIVSGKNFLKSTDVFIEKAKNGKTVVINDLPEGMYDIADVKVKVKPCGMRALHFVSRKTSHPLVKDFTPYDFRLWYSDADDMITPLIRNTFTADGATPILTSGNSLRGSAWGQKLYTALACGEIPCGKGKIIINQVDLETHLKNPVALIFRNRLYTY